MARKKKVTITKEAVLKQLQKATPYKPFTLSGYAKQVASTPNYRAKGVTKGAVYVALHGVFKDLAQELPLGTVKVKGPGRGRPATGYFIKETETA